MQSCACRTWETLAQMIDDVIVVLVLVIVIEIGSRLPAHCSGCDYGHDHDGLLGDATAI